MIVAVHIHKALCKGIITLLLISLAFSHAPAQEVSVYIRSDRNEYLIGEHAKIEIMATGDRMTPIRWPSFTDTLSAGLSILRVDPVDTVKDADGIYHYDQTLIISAYDTGHFIVRPVDLYYKISGSEELKTASTAALILIFRMPEVDEKSEIRDIKGPITLPYTFLELLPWILLLLAVIATAIIVTRYLRRKRRRQRTEVIHKEPETAFRPWETALAGLERLKAGALYRHGQLKPFYTELSGILRNYLRDGLDIDAPELTTKQTLKKLSAHKSIRSDLQQKVALILQVSDLVKFAKSSPDEKESEALLDDAITFVADTAPAHVDTQTEEVGG